MPEPEIIRLMEQFRAGLLKRERQSSMRLVNAYGDIYKRLLPRIDALDAEIQKMRAEGDDVGRSKLARMRRLKELKAQLEQEVSRFGAFAEAEMREGAREAINAANNEARQMVQAALPGIEPLDAAIMARWNRLPTEAVETILGFLSEDSPLSRMMRDEYGPETARLFGERMVEGIALGQNPRVVARQAAGVGLTWALRTARTTHIYAYREAARANYVANSDVVQGWRWRSAKQDNTCMSCLAMDGKEFPLTEPLNDHDNGKCFPEPITISYRDLGLDVDEPERAVQNGRDWFESQPENKQQQLMGRARWKAWKAGEFSFDDLTRTGDHPVWGEIRSENSLKGILGEEKAREYYG